MIQLRWPILLYTGYLLVGIATIFHFNGTGDSGDSITHFLISKAAFAHPEQFFNHWGKPVFVLFSSPFAQFGFDGIKVFNLIVAILAAAFTHLAAIRIGLKNAWLIPLFFLFAPYNYIITFSGLTEPLFSLFLAVAFWLAFSSRQVTAAVLVSFLPFIRSEGLLIIGVFGLLFLVVRNWKALAALSVGHVALGLAGVLVGKPIHWVISEIPYATSNSVYGSGSFLAFPSKLVFIIGIPLLILFTLGVFFFIFQAITDPRKRTTAYLILSCFISVFLFHTLAWTFGMFNAMGLKRVMIGVMPSMMLLALVGFNLLTQPFSENPVFNRLIKVAVILSVIVFPFTENHAAIKWKRDMNLWPDQILAEQIADELTSTGIEPNRYVYNFNYFSLLMDVDHYDQRLKRHLNSESLATLHQGDLIIWDNLDENGGSSVSLNELISKPELRLITSQETLWRNDTLTFAAFYYE
jgi:hypothetical protein